MSEESDRLQEVWYDLDQYWLPNDLKTVICRVIMRLPDNVRDFATNNCTFIAFDNSLLGLCLPASQFTHLTRRGRTMRNHYTILLNASIATKNDGQFTVAHEIAHAWLRRAGGKTKRGRREPIMTNDFLAEERADKLVESWGFKVPKHRRNAHAHDRAWLETNNDRRTNRKSERDRES